MTAERLHEDKRYRVTLFRGGGDARRLTVSFEHGHNGMRGSFSPAQYPGYAQRMGMDVVQVQASWRDWYVSTRSAALAGVLERATGGRAEVICTGFSMGGYGALLYSGACHARRLMLVSPQYSIDPALAPFDAKRHEKFARIGMPMPRPEERGNTAATGLLLYDPTIGADRAHMALIARAFPRLATLALPYGGHPATGVIAATGAVGRLATMVATDCIDPQAIRQMHRDNRARSDSYRLNLASAALRLHPQRALPELLRLAQAAEPELRFEAGILLLERNHPEAPALLDALLDEVANPPRAWRRRLSQALRRAETADAADDTAGSGP